jgi:hypothetical protein
MDHQIGDQDHCNHDVSHRPRRIALHNGDDAKQAKNNNPDQREGDMQSHAPSVFEAGVGKGKS